MMFMVDCKPLMDQVRGLYCDNPNMHGEEYEGKHTPLLKSAKFLELNVSSCSYSG